MNIGQILTLLGQGLAQAEQFLAGQPVTVTIPSETIDISGVKVEISGQLTLKKG